MNQYKFTTKGTCSREIQITLEKDIIKDVKFIGGCPGNTFGVATLCAERSIDEVISKLKGIKCGLKPTSCPDQLATALQQIKEENNL